MNPERNNETIPKTIETKPSPPINEPHQAEPQPQPDTTGETTSPKPNPEIIPAQTETNPPATKPELTAEQKTNVVNEAIEGDINSTEQASKLTEQMADLQEK